MLCHNIEHHREWDRHDYQVSPHSVTIDFIRFLFSSGLVVIVQRSDAVGKILDSPRIRLLAADGEDPCQHPPSSCCLGVSLARSSTTDPFVAARPSEDKGHGVAPHRGVAEHSDAAVLGALRLAACLGGNCNHSPSELPLICGGRYRRAQRWPVQLSYF